MGAENSTLWSLLGATTGRTECQAGWERYFAGRSKTLSRFFLPTGVPADFYPHPSGGLDLVIEPVVTGSFRAVCPETGADDWVPPIRLSFEAAQGHTFDLEGLTGELCGACGITPDWKDEGDGLFRLGSCGVKTAYAYFGFTADAPSKIAGFLNRRAGTAGCIMVPHEDAATSGLGIALGVADVPLCACFEVGTNGIKGTCGKQCLVVGRKAAVDTPVLAKVFYVVNGRFRIEGDFSKVTALQSKEPVWGLQMFTRMIVKVLLLECNRGGLTSDMIYDRARAAFEVEYPESLKCERGQSMIPQRTSLVQYLRVQRKGRKKPHPLYDELRISGQKPAVYTFDGKVIQREEE